MGWTYWALNGEDSYARRPRPHRPPTGSTAGAVSCHAVYSLTNTWSGGLQAQIVLSDTGATAISTWTLTFTFGGDQKITQLWNGTSAQPGEQVTVTITPYNATIAPSGSVTIGFTGTYTASNAAPASFAVNGTPCT